MRNILNISCEHLHYYTAPSLSDLNYNSYNTAVAILNVFFLNVQHIMIKQKTSIEKNPKQ